MNRIASNLFCDLFCCLCRSAGRLATLTHRSDRLTVYSSYSPTKSVIRTDQAAIVVFKVNGLGALEQEGIFPTEGYSSANDSAPSPCVDASRSRLFVPNNMSNDVSVFTIHGDGSLEPVPGSPFPTGDGTMSATLHPNGNYLYVSQWRESTLGVYEIADSGQLIPVQTVGYFHTGLSAITPEGTFLYLAGMINGVRGYRIEENGNLIELPESPFTYPDMDRPQGIKLSSDGNTLFVLDVDTGIAAFRVEENGELSLVTGSPFALGGFATAFALTHDDRYIYGSAETQIQGFSVLPNGSLSTLPDSPFSEIIYLWAMLSSPDADRLYVGNSAEERIQTFSIAPDGSLEETGEPVGVQDDLGRLPRGMIYYRPAAITKIPIDIKPENRTNPVNPRSHGVTPVALLGTEDFDVTTVDVTTLRFGPDEAAPAHDLTDGWPYNDPLRDVNCDGFVDLLVHFKTQETGILCGDTEATLTGTLQDGSAVEGTDSIRTVGCSYKARAQHR